MPSSKKRATKRTVEKKILPTLQDFLLLTCLIEKGDISGVVYQLRLTNITPRCCELIQSGNLIFDRYILEFPVCVASKSNHTDLMNTLIDLGYNPQEKCYSLGKIEQGPVFHMRPIHHGCAVGHLSVVRSLVEDHGVNVETLDGHNNSPLYTAVVNNQSDIVRYLLDNGASVNTPCSFDNSFLLHTAARNKLTGICDLLISRGASVNACDNKRNSPLHDAVVSKCEYVASVLISAGANVNHQNAMGNTPFLKVFMSYFDLPSLQMMFLLQSGGADAGARDKFGNTSLHFGVAEGVYDACRFLILELNVCVNVANIFDETPLDIIMGRDYQNVDIIQLFVEAGYNPRQRVDLYEDDSPLFESETGTRFLQYLREVAENTRTLQDLCIYKLRHILGRNLPFSVSKLSLPQRLKNLIRLLHVLPNVLTHNANN